MTVAHVQDTHKASVGSAASVTLHLASNTTAGNTLFSAFCLPFGASVVSVNDTISGRWIQSAYASSTDGNVELWYSRGIQGGNASVTCIFSAASVDTNVSEFSGVWYRAPLDQWSQTVGTSASVTPTTVTTREAGDLVIAVGNSAASVGLPTGGFTALTMDGTGNAAAYDILSGSIAPAMHWAAGGASVYCALEAAFLPSNSDFGVNPLLQFPEVSVQIATGQNFLAPIEGVGVWVDVSSYVKSMTLGPIGRQHELDRIQASAAQLTVNNRDGTFNTWNTGSFLQTLGCLEPMSPVKVTAAWNGVTYPEYYGYIQAVTPVIGDVQNIDSTIACYDILQMLSLKYLSNNNYQSAVLADGAISLYRLGDPVGTFSVADAASVNTGSLLAGNNGVPLYGVAGPYLYDPSHALDLTNGTNLLNGGVQMVDNTTEPPTIHNPLASASAWTFETWAKWTGTTTTTSPFSSIIQGYTTPGNFAIYLTNLISGPPVAVGDGITGPGIPIGTVVTNLLGPDFDNDITISQAVVGLGASVSTIGSTTNGAATLYLTSFSGPTGVVGVGSNVAGPGIPAGTVITGFAGAAYDNDIYLSSAATSTNSAVTYIISAGNGVVSTFYATGGAVGSTLFTATVPTAGEVDVRVGTQSTSQGSIPVTTFIGSTTNGAASVFLTEVIGGYPLSVGQTVAGPNIPSGTTITRLAGPNYDNDIVISHTATGTINGANFTATGAAIGTSVAYSNRVGVGTVSNGAFTTYGVSNVANVQDGNWHHLVVTSSASVVAIYVDGHFDSQWSTVTSYIDPTSILFGCNAGAQNGWVGWMKDIALYPSALSAGQINNHYNTGMWFQLQEFGASVGTSAAGRFNKLMAVAGLPSASMLTVPYGFKTMMYAETNAITTTSALNYMQTLTETEPGLIFQGQDGKIRAYSRQYQYLNPTTVNSQYLFADVTGTPYYYDGPSLQIAADDLDTWNDIQVQSGRSGSQLQEWGPTQSHTAAVSASVSGSRTLQGLTSLQMAYDSDALAIAQNYAQWYNNPINRVVQISPNSRSNAGVNLAAILGLGLMDRFSILYAGTTPSSPFAQDSVIEQITHTVDMSNPTWDTVWAMSPYEILLSPFLFANGQNQMSGAASVTGSGTAWVQHATGTHLASGTVTYTVASGATTTVPYTASASQVQTALAALVASTTVSGGPINTANVNITFGSSQGSFSAYFRSGNQLTL